MQATIEGRRRPKLFPPLALARHQENAAPQPCALSGAELRRIVTAIIG
ncbi:MAG TPA: hypothetical protein VNT77_02160 [Allosphingosinicella sp.]|nr:hypothetical protein [Allosphingosinicella sp.]